mmetsp:Transcript_108896/g.340719  ORF Transcript_108896/g.340719 Transcript_108896/m.340719 type:complete len:242 (+) Transcript_108896:12-737(+)
MPVLRMGKEAAIDSHRGSQRIGKRSILALVNQQEFGVQLVLVIDNELVVRLRVRGDLRALPEDRVVGPVEDGVHQIILVHLVRPDDVHAPADAPDYEDAAEARKLVGGGGGIGVLVGLRDLLGQVDAPAVERASSAGPCRALAHESQQEVLLANRPAGVDLRAVEEAPLVALGLEELLVQRHLVVLGNVRVGAVGPIRALLDDPVARLGEALPEVHVLVPEGLPQDIACGHRHAVVVCALQ